MSFMFNPYPFDDPQAVNRPELPRRLTDELTVGVAAIVRRLRETLPKGPAMVALDGYVGSDGSALIEGLQRDLPDRKVEVIDVANAYQPSAALEALLAETLPEDRDLDPILLFGKCIHRGIDSLFDPAAVDRVRERVASAKRAGGLAILRGCGAAAAPFRDLSEVKVFLDLTPRHVTTKVRAGRVRALGDAGKRTLGYLFRRLYYYDYEIMMAHRQELIDAGHIDFYVDANHDDSPKMLPLAALKEIFAIQARQPLRATPVYIEGVWGGQFVKRLRGLPEDMRNCAWVFDMIANEVAIQIRVGGHTLLAPFSTFFKTEASAVLGRESLERFGPVFPIRFNYDDTLGGAGNMSIQVHPPQAYCQQQFGEPCQQDESYYVVKTAGSKTYLGLRDDCDPGEFFRAVDDAEAKGVPFDHDRYVNSFPSREGDQFLLPGGTVHASGQNQVVLEIGSYTIGSYTFKLYDYLRRDLDGQPRPIHSRHGKAVLDRDCRRASADGVLRPEPRIIREGDGWREEILGEHEAMYFSLRRLSFERSVADDTAGRFHVLVLVEGEEVLVCAAGDPARCYRQRFMDMVVVPATLGPYRIVNLGSTPCRVTKTLLK